MIASEFHVQRW